MDETKSKFKSIILSTRKKNWSPNSQEYACQHSDRTNDNKVTTNAALSVITGDGNQNVCPSSAGHSTMVLPQNTHEGHKRQALAVSKQSRKRHVKQDNEKNFKKSHRNHRKTKSNLESYAYYNDALETNEERLQTQPVDGSIQKLDSYSISETDDFGQIDYVANKQRKRSHSEAHPKYPNFTLKLSYQAVIFDKICYSIPKEGNFVHNMLLPWSTRVDAIPILKSINLNIPQGTIFGLLGPSSCGKTTLLRCLVGLLQPTSGSIRLFGHDLIDNNSKRIDSKLCHVPGRNVGYMPQDLGLYEDFSIKDLLTMFGGYLAMPADLIEQRIDFMTKFLDLPDTNRIVMSLSGGQKRRVSFALACLHMPPLIILDEPTVGVDPVLRKSIWTFLRRLATFENITILITTHYIEEARRADQVAFMRSGEIIMQDTPDNIMQSQSTTTLEEAFLKVCSQKETSPTSISDRIKYLPSLVVHEAPTCDPNRRLSLVPNPSYIKLKELHLSRPVTPGTGNLSRPQVIESELDPEHGYRSGEVHKRTSRLNPMNSDNREKFILENISSKDAIRFGVNDESSSSYKPTIGDNEMRYSIQCRSTNTVIVDPNDLSKSKFKFLIHSARKDWILFKSLMYKNYKRNFHSKPLVAFQFLLPIVQMITFCLCVGGKPTNIGLGVVNMDNSSSYLTTSENGEQLEHLSSAFFSYIDTSMLDLRHYTNLNHAINDVREAKLWAVMEFKYNFTDAVTQRFGSDDLLETDPATINESLIRLHSDKTNRIIDILCLRSLLESFRTFLTKKFVGYEHLPVEIAQPIFSIKPSIIGESVDGYTESIAAGLMASLTYFMATGLTTFIMVVERGAGILERTYTTGITPFTYVLAHAIYRSLMMMAQIAFLMCLTFFVLDQPLVGSAMLTYTLLVALNCAGISFGLLISSLCQDQNGAALGVVASLVVKLTLSGILWPLEAVPYWLRIISYIQPLTMPVKALRNITLKGRNLNDKSVSLGFLICFIWFVIFITIASKKFKFYK